MWIKLTILSFILIGSFENVASDINMVEYYKMPPLHRQDDYERCLWSTEELSTYCTVSTIIKPDPSNAIWNQIEEYSKKTKIHFAHDVLFSGQCLSECQKMLSELSEDEREELYVDAFPHTRKFTYDITAYKNGTLYRKMYDKIFNQCENLWLRKNWNLTGYSTVLWCTTNQEFDHYETDYLHTLFWVVTIFIVAIVAAATGLDIIQNNEDSLNYYKVERRDLPKSQQCLLCFSLVRNWYRLVAPPKTEVGRDLRFVMTIRYLTTFMAVIGHVWIGYSFTPSINPEFVEKSYDSFVYIFVNCATNIVQTFFVVSGVLLYISINEVFKKGVVNVGYAVSAFLYRYIRLTPTYAYLILYQATYLFHSGSGAYWKFYTETQQTYCRRNWWTNLLYINNYVNANQMLTESLALFVLSNCVALVLGLLIEFPLTALSKTLLRPKNEEYYKMPPLHRNSDFERCLWSSKKELATICTISTLIKPDPSNAIWNQIEEFSSKTKIHFAHDVLFSGSCILECQKTLSKLSDEEREQLYVEEFPHTRKVTVVL
ncbi:uncharacterized protein LOC134828568 [Culicoides brevitarsis]|uniref:uncharacterized protein LOC134828568 n=1 Tax=Culicoides brevitarsis TaxID=469753 RepID=UPI00307B4193